MVLLARALDCYVHILALHLACYRETLVSVTPEYGMELSVHVQVLLVQLLVL